MTEIDMTDSWVGGIPDHHDSPCAKCGQYKNVCYYVSDEFWLSIMSDDEDRRAVVCLMCFDEICESRNIDMTHFIEKVFYTGIGKTIEMKPIKEYIYHKNKIPKDDKRTALIERLKALEVHILRDDDGDYYNTVSTIHLNEIIKDAEK